MATIRAAFLASALRLVTNMSHGGVIYRWGGVRKYGSVPWLRRGTRFWSGG